MRPTRSYVICSTYRSGSYLLCQGLRDSGGAGQPDEYFEPRQLDHWRQALGVKGVPYSDEYIHKVFIRGASSNGVFGLKLHRPACRSLIQAMKWGNIPSKDEIQFLDSLFPRLRFVWLTRIDKLRQAISWYRAIQTGMWWRTSETPICSLQEPIYRYEPIDQLHKLLQTYDSEWEAILKPVLDRTHIISYEELTENHARVLRETLQFLQVDMQHDMSAWEPTLIKQGDSVTERWVKHYLEHCSQD